MAKYTYLSIITLKLNSSYVPIKKHRNWMGKKTRLTPEWSIQTKSKGEENIYFMQMRMKRKYWGSNTYM